MNLYLKETNQSKFKTLIQKKSIRIVSILTLIALTATIFFPNQRALGTDFTPSGEAYHSTPTTLNNTLANYQTTTFTSPTDYNNVNSINGTSVTTTAQVTNVCPATMTDIDGNTYNTVQIGTQCWMRDNLQTTKYADGTSITRGPTGATWNTNDNGYYAYPPNTGNTAEETLANIQSNKLGFAYQWSAAMKGSTTDGTQGVCPTDWHLPTDQEYKTLEGTIDSTYGVGNAQWDNTGWRGADAGTKMKTVSATTFSSPLAGYRNTGGSFYVRGTYAYLCSSTQYDATFAWSRYLGSGYATVYRGSFSKANAWSVRCLKNSTLSTPSYASQLYTFDTSAYQNQSKLDWTLLSFATAQAAPGITVKIWNNSTSVWDSLGALANSSGSMPGTPATYSISSNVSNYLDAGKKVRILIHSTNPSVSGTNAVLNTDYLKLTVWVSPAVSTSVVSAVMSNSATGNGNVTNTNGENPTSRVIEWGTSTGNYSTGSCDAGTGGSGTYSCEMTGLSPSTTYYYHAKATNSSGTGTGSEMSFTTPALPIITVTNPNTNPAQSKTLTAGADKGTLNQYVVTSGNTCDGSLSPFISYASTTFSTEADNGKKICYRSVDATSGTVYQMSNAIAGIDVTAPVITIANPNISSAQSKTITASTDSGTLTQFVVNSGNTCDGSLSPFVSYASTNFATEADNGKKVCYKAIDTASNTTYLMSNAIAGIDTTAPTGTANINSDATYTNSTSVTLNNNITGASEMRFKNEAGGTFSSWFTYATSYAWNLVAGDGLKTVYSEFRDLADNTQSTNDTITLDTNGPTITITNPNTNPAQSKTITAGTSDGTLTQSVTNGNTCDNSLTFSAYSSITFNTEADNGKKVCYKAVDTASNTTYLMSNAIAGIDKTNPTIGADNNSSNWQISNPTITLNSTDANLNYSKYAWDSDDATCRTSGTAFTDGNTINIPSQGSHTLYLCNADVATNQNSWNGTYKLDSVNPSISNVAPSCTNTTDPTFTVTATDATSNLDTNPYSFDAGVTWQSQNSKSYQDFNHTISANTIKVKDQAGNIASYVTPIIQTCVSTSAVTTNAVTTMTSIGATGNGNITATNGENPERMIEWGINLGGPYPNSCTANTGGTGAYSCAITGLTSDTTYYVRAKATNSAGTTYGSEVSFHSLPPAVVISNPDPTKITDANNSNYFTIGTGTLSNTNQATTNLDLTLTTNLGTATLPVNTTITNTLGGNLDMSQLTITNATNSTRSTVSTTRGSIEIGIPGTRLSFSQPIEVSIDIEPVYNGEVLTVQSKSAGSSTWSNEGTCTVTNGKCSFTTTHATTYTVNGDGSLKGETDVQTSLPINSTISLNCTDSLTMSSITGTGQSSITGNNEATCNVKTNNSNGYKLEWSTGSTNLTNATADTINGYTPAVANTPEAWSLTQTDSEWGARIKSTSTDANTTLWGATDDYTGKWLNIASSAFQVISRSTETAQTGSDEVIQFGAEIGSNKFQPTGTYTTSVVMTATTL